MTFAISGKIDGLGGAIKSLDGLKNGMRNQVMRRALAAAAKPIIKEARANVLVDTGWLKKSLGVVFKVYASVAVAVIGPRTLYVKDLKTRKLRLTQFGKRLLKSSDDNRPANYAHLVEYGHAGPAPAPPHPFLRPAFDTAKDAAKQAFIDTVRDELSKLVVRGRIAA